jgi:hypothetical protein
MPSFYHISVRAFSTLITQASGCGPCARIIANRFRQSFTFQSEHAALEGFRGIVREHVAGALKDDWAVVVFIVDPVDRTSRNLDAEVYRRFVNAQPVHALAAKRRYERGMDVQHTVLVVAGDQQVFQIPAHDNKLRTRCPNRIEQSLGMILWMREIAAPDDLRRYIRRGGVLKPSSVVPRTDHESKLNWQGVGIPFLEQIAQRGPATGNQNRDREMNHELSNGQGGRDANGDRRNKPDTIR